MKTSKQIAFILTGAALLSLYIMKESREAWAYHNFFFRSADDITSGVLNALRLDASSVTMQGPTPGFGAFQGTGLRSTHTVSGVGGGLIQNNLGVISSTMMAPGIIISGFDLIVGTPGALNVQAYFDGLASFNAILSSRAMAGLTNSATATARIGLMSGVYHLSRATIPAGAWFEGIGSSVVFVDDGGIVQQFLKVYGRLTNIKLDISGQAFTSPKIQIGSGAIVESCDIYGARNQVSGGVAQQFGSILYVGPNTIKSRLDKIGLLDPIALAGANYAGDIAPLVVYQSSDSVINFREWRAGPFVSGTNGGIIRSTRIIISGDFYDMGGNGFVFNDGTVDSGMENFRMDWTQGIGASGSILVFGENSGSSQSVSTRCFINNGYIRTNINATASLISAQHTSPRTTSGLTIRNFTGMCDGTNSWTGINFFAGTQVPVVANVDINGCSAAISDSGVGLVKDGFRFNAKTQ